MKGEIIMKKLLLVLLVVALASFLFVGCLPTTPGGEGEGEGEGEVGICPTITIAGSYTDPVSGKTYINGNKAEEVVVTFAQPTEGVNIYLSGSFVVGMLGAERTKDVSIWDLPLAYTVSPDGTTYTASLPTGLLDELDCVPFMIKVVSCEGECECLESFIVDTDLPYANIEVCIDECTCDGCTLSFASTSQTVCDETTEYCGDDCSGLASWSVNVYDDYPFDECCDASCETPIASDSGVCPIDFTTPCLTTYLDEEGESVFVVFTLVDNVGNEVKYGVEVGTCDYDTCDEVWIDPITYDPNACIDDATDIFTVCEGHECEQP